VTRLEIALPILCAMVPSGGGKAEKVAAAFEYADLVLLYSRRATRNLSHDARGTKRAERTRKEVTHGQESRNGED
jgi:hypothetical protein